MNQPPITPIRQKLTLPFGYHPKRHDIQTCIITCSAMRAQLTVLGNLVFVAVVSGCATTPAFAPHGAQESARTTSTTQTQPLPAGDERDRQVLECLGVYLLRDPEFRMTMTSVSGSADARELNVVLHCRKLGGISFELASEDWLGDSAPAGFVSEDTRSDLTRRNPRPKGHDQPSFQHWILDRRVVMAEVSGMPAGLGSRRAFENAHPKAKGWFAAYLPGYSSDGARALVHAWIGPSEHGACMTAFLAFVGDHWEVKWRRFVYYA